MTQEVDLFIVGGGINGAAVARDAAGRGLKVMLAEKNDYGSATSSASSKLIHGGLRYLEHREFPLVRESLHERAALLEMAPHLVTPMRFLVPLTYGRSRPSFIVRAGLLLYDLLAGRRRIEWSGRLSRDETDALPRLRKEGLTSVLHYPDCWADDARLVLETLLDARARGADVANRREVTAISPTENGYAVSYLQDGHTRDAMARFVVNAAGPWTNKVLDKVSSTPPRRQLRLVRGSHIVIAMPQPSDTTAFTLQNPDGRVVFTIPWQNGRYLVVGTTDAPHDGNPEDAACSIAERDYLLEAYNRYFDHPGAPAAAQDVVWTWSGVRPLVDDGAKDPSKVTRDSQLLVSRAGTGALVSIYGGKLTTHRALADKVMKRLKILGANIGGSWTAASPLHGGELNAEELARWCEHTARAHPGLPVTRWTHTYGSHAQTLLDHVRVKDGANTATVGGVLHAELEYAMQVEDVKCAEDFLYRRTKLFLDVGTEASAEIDEWIQDPKTGIVK